MTTVAQAGHTTAVRFLSLEVGTRCQLQCRHCYNDSGPRGGFGTMRQADWEQVVDQAAAMGVQMVQIIGGEPTLYPHLVELVEHAVGRGLWVEVFTNLVHVTPAQWRAFRLPGVRLATSYYSDDPGEHAAIVGRPTLERTRANLARAAELGITVRAGVIDLGGGQRVAQARADLVALGLPQVGYDQVRALGRADPGGCGRAAELCGGCGDGIAAVGPDGQLTACVMARSETAGDVRVDGLAGAVAGLPRLREALLAAGMPQRDAAGCAPDGDQCYPVNCHPRW